MTPIMRRSSWQNITLKKTPDIMQRDREEEIARLLRSLGPARLWPARRSLAHPDTNCTSGKQLTDLSASHWSAKWQWFSKTSWRGLSSSSCPLPRRKDADHFTHKEQAKHSHQGNHQRCSGISGLQQGWLWLYSGLQVCDSQWYYSFSVCCWASWRTGCKCWLLLTVVSY